LINYKDPKKDQKKGVIEDLAGNDVETFTNYTAEPIIGFDSTSLKMAVAENPMRAVNAGNPVLSPGLAETLLTR
ncbi:MAG: hypothetical protein AB8E87_12145, partial [Prochlorococcus sp.]